MNEIDVALEALDNSIYLLNNTFNELNVSLEDATLEAIKTLFNKELKDAKNQLHNATKNAKKW